MTLPWTQGILCAPSSTGNPVMLGGFSVARTGEPQSNDVNMSAVQFDDSPDSYLANTTQQALGFADAWTIQLFCSSQNAGVTGSFFEIGGTANSSRIKFETNAGGGLVIELDNAAGTLFKSYTYANNLVLTNQWTVFTITWNGTSLVFYKNGVAQTPTATTTDNADSMTNSNRDIYVGASSATTDGWRGSIASMIIWAVALTQNQVRAAFNQGSGGYFNPLRNQDDYGQATSVAHWWRFGHKPSDIGKDYGLAATLVDIDANASGITSGDLEVQGPNFGSLSFSTDEIVAKGAGGAGGGSSTTTLGVANTFSIEVWVKPNGIGATTIFDANKGDSNVNRDSDDRIELRINSSNFEFRVFNASGTGVTVVSSVNAVVDRWYHIVMVKDGTSRASLYIHGIEDAFTTTSVPTTTDASRIVGIGAIPITPSAFFNGLIGHVAVWDVALGSAAIQALRNGGHRSMNRSRSFGAYTSAASLKHWWRCGRPKGSIGAGGDYIVDEVPGGGIDLTANAANMSADDVFIQTATEEILWTDGTSLGFDGAADFLENSSTNTIGITDSWTISAWLSPTATASRYTAFELWNGSSNVNRIELGYAGNIASDPFAVNVYDSGGTLAKNYRWFSRFGNTNTAMMFHVVVTWNGTDLLVYADGLEVTPTLVTDIAGTQTATSRRVSIGYQASGSNQFFAGRIGQVAVWSSVLTAAEILELWTKGWNIDLRSAAADYASQATLVHWWKPSEDSSDLGNDFVTSGAIDLTPTSLDDTDIRAAAPGRDLVV